MHKVLFLCTGNYYRSRFAEELFNHLASSAGLPWRADSRALDIELGNRVNVGPVSRHAREALQARGITLAEPVRFPQGLSEADFGSAGRVIALKESEHRPLLESHFAAFAGRVEYWQIHDLDQAAPADALADVEARVRRLIQALAVQSKRG